MRYIESVRLETRVLVVALTVWLLPVPALAATSAPTFQLTTPQLQGEILPGAQGSLTFARFSPGEEVQRYGLTLPPGASLHVQVLEPPGHPPLEVVVFSNAGQEETLPTDTPPGRAWLGPLPLARTTDAQVTIGGRQYVILLQTTAAPAWVPYALGVNWTAPALGRWDWASVWRVPWRLCAGVIWWLT